MSQFISLQGIYRINFSTKCIVKIMYYIYLHLFSVGQCGNQIGSAFWPLALHEYGVQTTNTGMNLLKTQRDHVKNISDLSDAFDSFFVVPDNSHDLCFRSITDLKRAKVKARVY